MYYREIESTPGAKAKKNEVLKSQAAERLAKNARTRALDNLIDGKKRAKKVVKAVEPVAKTNTKKGGK